MKKLLTSIVAVMLVLAMVVSLCACGGGKKEDAAQGVDIEKHTITVGNTAATSGIFAGVGVPFNYGLEAYLWYFNNHTDGYKDADNNKYTVLFKHYDDGFDAAQGQTLTEKLVEDDQVFALVGHFGSNTVAATVDYIEQQGIPMVYGVCGVPQLFNTEKNVMTVQPIYNTEGMSMLATAVAPVEGSYGFGATKVGVIATTDEAGVAIKAGIQAEATKLGLVTGTDIFYFDVEAGASDHAAAVNGLKAQGCDVVIIAANQAPFINIANQFVASSYDNVKIITSYVSANATAMGGLVATGAITETRKVYAGAWLLTGSAPSETKGWTDFVEYVRIMTLYAKEKGEALITNEDPTYGAFLPVYFPEMEWAKDGVSSQFLNSYAMAGYVAANVFCDGLTRTSGKVLTWKNFINAMESEVVDVPMGGSVNYANGQRIGIDALAIQEYTPATAVFNGQTYRSFVGIAALEEEINK